MVLIPMETIERFQRRVSDGVGTAVSPTINSDSAVGTDPVSGLDGEMNNILKHPTKDDAEKWKLYQQALQRYLFFANESRKPLRVDVYEKADNADGKIANKEQFKTDVKSAGTREEEKGEATQARKIISAVPAKFNAKAKLLMGMLSEASTRLTWNNDGAISLDGVPVPGTNIVDLVNHTMRNRKTFDPVGRVPFARFLHALNVPREYVGNENFWKDIRAFDNESIADISSSRIASSSTRNELDHTPSGLPRLRRGRRLADHGGGSGAESEAYDTEEETPVSFDRRGDIRLSRDRSSAEKRAKIGAGKPRWRTLRLKK